ncbi:DUF5906 domain-containing protein [Tropicimonas sp. IMCC6043]|uniref:DUF5906 domain-containing protein n=1 Tax=Tropicimonas sp. IMCC6043 TaxID=2510645 RepID=UPI00101BB164|nr:DUF5906 domain-containing protein [Tropicimonas sp. IMCC6043]RYH07784.1 hypothetical protein EU800_18855 [Tropicimonas sp. IMCC6043]
MSKEHDPNMAMFHTIEGGLAGAQGGAAQEDVGLVFEDIKEYRDVAQLILEEEMMSRGIPTVKFWRGQFWTYVDGMWLASEQMEGYKDAMFFEIHRILSRSSKQERRRRDRELVTVVERVKPTSTLVNEVRTALISLVSYTGPDMAWISGEGPAGMHACRNGFVNVETGEIVDPTPRFFNTRRLNADIRVDLIDADTFEEAWLASSSNRFFGQTFERDPGQIGLLQEIVGYILFGGMEQHKIFQIIGKKRSGKGTVNNMLKHLMGGAACAPSTRNLEGDFALQPLENKLLATITDARIDKNTNHGALSEMLLAISGGDPRDISRKYMTTLVGVYLTVRFLILSNSLAPLRDADGALADRIVYLQTTGSWLGKEDHELLDKLKEEADLWLMWARLGYLRLRRQRYFTQTETHMKLRNKSVAKMAPIKTWLDEYVEEDIDGYIPVDDIFAIFRKWADQIGIARWNKARLISSIHDATDGTTRPTRPQHTRTFVDADGKPVGSSTKRERAVAGIIWQKGKRPSEEEMREIREFYWEEDRLDEN